MTIVGTLARINRFPVKSMQGESLDVAEIDQNGIVGDRTWALRDVETTKLVSAKRPRLWQSVLGCRATGTDDDVVVELPSGERFAVSDAALLAALEDLLGRVVTLEVATGPGQGVYASDWPEIEGISLSGEIDLPTNLTGEGTSFVDVGVLHILTTASLAALGSVGPATADAIERFRPSIVIETPDLDGFAEDAWAGRAIRIGDVELAVGDPTPRCVMTTLEQPGLPAEKGVLTTLAAHHRISTPLGTYACLGSYASVTTPGVVRVGDVVALD
jgi:uncharacterized protein